MGLAAVAVLVAAVGIVAIGLASRRLSVDDKCFLILVASPVVMVWGICTMAFWL